LLVALFFSVPRIQQGYRRLKANIDRFTGAVMVFLGGRLLLEH
jgi:threonine/homoserine/homoserine lactone efflux protein